MKNIFMVTNFRWKARYEGYSRGGSFWFQGNAEGMGMLKPSCVATGPNTVNSKIISHI